ncbi:uncharacterized protein [Physcomitrium patens]|uniref:AP2/ERF domain-containing protein n=1 Tax=Physcomitrium patens TaxID=3218 RepID=A0A2K1J3T1_PHYPA|nr:ethylene-responsive transcription factor ERF114-like [Physcomitrium patens]PNR36183.1 hypothetical protein PHYPA_022034 [Physcomitrium patens]|eukprot:XP_024400289.1 ethylene-responsive transcription factor ERF114-like [Physcomitrella patens]
MARMFNSSDNYGYSSSDCPSSNSHRRTYMCKVCGNHFNSGQSLGGHMNVHRNDRRSPSNCQYNRSKGSPTYSSPGAGSGDECSTQFKGVRYRKEQNRWVAEIRPPRSSKTWWLGTYSTPTEAAYAYDVAIKYFGSETSLNFDGHPVYDQIPTISTTMPKDFAMQLREVVKKYGKLAMQSDGSGRASFSFGNAYNPYETYPPPYTCASNDVDSDDGEDDEEEEEEEEQEEQEEMEEEVEQEDEGQPVQEEENWENYVNFPRNQTTEQSLDDHAPIDNEQTPTSIFDAADLNAFNGASYPPQHSSFTMDYDLSTYNYCFSPPQHPFLSDYDYNCGTYQPQAQFWSQSYQYSSY